MKVLVSRAGVKVLVLRQRSWLEVSRPRPSSDSMARLSMARSFVGRKERNFDGK